MSTTIHQEVEFSATADRIYAALTDGKQFGELTGAPTEISPEAGGTFSCFGGMILGRNIELVPNQRIVQAWRVANWPEGVYSIAKFELKEQGSKTLLVFSQIGFPEEEGKHLEAGWHENYWNPLEKYAG
ncbi:SRPBCC family protein [Neobacillus ginsengisoli]|uniref:Activator of HSP90 ATPase n=1 Tax=Neobacillus ginsengisoli TaxID=904295 RepID=A0ABT9XY86_9BACI|nr:SRPBCC family protein [Neobacillus ginsengisoli]MDQ0200469.1 activator of HSP90 ATPase [Neobacillus ginsengisoli]